MIRAAIVGLGRWGRSLVASVQGKSTQLRFVRAHTRTRASAEEFCRQYDVPLVDSYEQILADPEVDAVVLATPHSLHETQIIAAAAAGKHIHVEKPITLDRAGADRAVEAARKAGVVLAVGYCRRFHPSIVEVRRRLAQGRLGAVVSMVAQHTTSTAQFIVPENWRAAPEEAPGGALTAVGVHALDHMIEFAGRVRDVRAVTARHYPGHSDDTTTLMLQFESGASGLIFCSVATATNFAFTLYGTAGLAEILEEVAGVNPDDVAEPKSFTEDLDVDSLSMVEVVVAAEEKFGVKIPDDEVQNLKTVGDAVTYILNHS